MNLTRRSILRIAAKSAIAAPVICSASPAFQKRDDNQFGISDIRRSLMSIETQTNTPTFSVTPVIGDGKWIWTTPPEDEQGYLEPRYFDITTEIKSTGNGDAANLVAATVLPSEFPEQKIVGNKDGALTGNASSISVQPLTFGARQLVMTIGRITEGQVNIARSTVRVELFKSYFGFEKDQFPEKQPKLNRQLRPFLGNSPGIKIRSSSVSKVVAPIKEKYLHPWDRAKAFHEWVFENIKGRPQNYTSVDAAIKNRVGDCEERAGVFIACCRSVGIPARLVWVPGHCWAEILLFNKKQKPNWIPIHTAGYSWFGWTGAHEVILQKGDIVPIPQNGKKVRLLYDHYRCRGRKPKLEYTASIKPVASSSEKEVGPGERRKLANGKWELVAKHKADKIHRDS